LFSSFYSGPNGREYYEPQGIEPWPLQASQPNWVVADIKPGERRAGIMLCHGYTGGHDKAEIGAGSGSNNLSGYPEVHRGI
jgi:hypothetical protein